jgi:predicted MPP superfamily phosphohydrolase
VLSHNPDTADEPGWLGYEGWILSGHTHGGQVVLPVIGAVAAREFPVIAGRGRRDATEIFVSRGIGTVYIPVRVNCPPEVAVLTLQPVNSDI